MTTLEQGDEKVPPARAPLSRLRAGRNDKTDVWAQSCATVGAVAWAGMAVLARVGVVRVGAIEVIFLFAPLVIVPLGMELGRILAGASWLAKIARLAQPLGAACAVVAIWLPPGRKAGLVALGWMLVCVLMAGDGVVRLGRMLRENRTAEAAVATGAGVTSAGVTLSDAALALAKIDLAVGGAWLVASRVGMRPMGIQEPIGLLTAVHFHYAGFATAIIAAAMIRFARGQGVWLKRLVAMVIGLPFVVAAGFVISPVLKMGAAALFSVSVAGLAVFLRTAGRRAGNAMARVLLQVAAGAVFAGMVLSAAYAVTDFVGSDALIIPQMARTHGLFNSIGFCLPGLLGWLLEVTQ